MYRKTTIIQNKTGLHMRPAAEFIRCAGGFRSTITLTKLATGQKGNAKSALSLLRMELSQGTEVELQAEGPDEQAAVEALIALVDGGFGELS